MHQPTSQLDTVSYTVTLAGGSHTFCFWNLHSLNHKSSFRDHFQQPEEQREALMAGVCSALLQQSVQNNFEIFLTVK